MINATPEHAAGLAAWQAALERYVVGPRAGSRWGWDVSYGHLALELELIPTGPTSAAMRLVVPLPEAAKELRLVSPQHMPQRRGLRTQLRTGDAAFDAAVVGFASVEAYPFLGILDAAHRALIAKLVGHGMAVCDGALVFEPWALAAIAPSEIVATLTELALLARAFERGVDELLIGLGRLATTDRAPAVREAFSEIVSDSGRIRLQIARAELAAAAATQAGFDTLARIAGDEELDDPTRGKAWTRLLELFAAESVALLIEAGTGGLPDDFLVKVGWLEPGERELLVAALMRENMPVGGMLNLAGPQRQAVLETVVSLAARADVVSGPFVAQLVVQLPLVEHKTQVLLLAAMERVRQPLHADAASTCLESPATPVRVAACGVLRAVGDPSHLPKLRALARISGSALRVAAEAAITAIVERAGGDAVVGALAVVDGADRGNLALI